MLFNIPRKYDHSATVYDLTNEDQAGFDNYEPYFVEMGVVRCRFGVSPNGGQLTMYVPEPLTVSSPHIRNPRNHAGQPLGRSDYLWRLDTPIPEVDAFGNVHGFTYITIESKD